MGQEESFETGSDLDEEEKKSVLDGEVSVKGLVKKMKNYSNIIILTGAGISVNAGIPDFRSNTGLYNNMKEFGIVNPMSVFSINFFRTNPIPFFKVMKKLLPKEGEEDYKPTKTHEFIKLLHDKGKLLRVYTQNIDGLEVEAGVPKEKVKEAHGNFRSCSCINCGKKYDVEEFKKRVYEDKYPIYCDTCTKPEDDEKKKYESLIKPDVVFFGESLPSGFFGSQHDDFRKCDLLIVMGTSLLVSPFCHLVHRCGPLVPRLLFNMEKVGPWLHLSEDNYRDVMMLGDCDVKTSEFIEMCGW